ncbi:hypothetical protein [Gordonia aurantiaca]|uniref:hypothetical protein n=1 Tax=Gordonia sp. B21 TaxID=3151852 RepID=UPI0032659122
MNAGSTGAAVTTARAAALASVFLGLVIVAAGFMRWVRTGHGIDANGFGFADRHLAELFGMQLTLGWFTTAFGLLVIVGGLAALYAVTRGAGNPHPGFALVAGAGVGAVVIAGAVPVRPLGLTLPINQLGMRSAAGDLGDPSAGIFILLAAALTSVVIGFVGISLGGQDTAGRRLLAVAIAAGAVIGVVAVVVVWWWLGRDTGIHVVGLPDVVAAGFGAGGPLQVA